MRFAATALSSHSNIHFSSIKQELCHHVYNEPEQLKKKNPLRVTLNKITITTILLNIRVHPRKGHEGPEGEWRYNPTLSLTLVLDKGGRSM
jgi:hypothetical protein